MSSEQQQKPRLDRRNAIKNIDYTACEWPLPSTTAFQTQSLEDLDRGSFRIQGADGEFDRICTFLGLSGPDDFAIPASAWEARKSRSYHFPSPSSGTSHNLEKLVVSGFTEYALSDAFQAHIRAGDKCSQARVREIDETRHDGNESRVSLRCNRHDYNEDDLSGAFQAQTRVGDKSSRLKNGLINLAEVQARFGMIDETRHYDNESRVSVRCGNRHDCIGDDLSGAFRPQTQDGDKFSRLRNGFINSAEVQARVRKIDEVTHDDNESRASVRCNRVGGFGIKGDRPHLLVPPPAITQPVIGNLSSNWDLMKSFGPDDDEEVCSTGGSGVTVSVVSKEEDRGIEEEDEGTDGKIVGKFDVGRALVRNDSAGQSCSDTSNDGKDEESSYVMTREPLNCISPNGEVKRRIKCWQKGDFLGSGSFGTVYEGFTDGGFFFAVKEVSLLDQGSQGKQSIFQLEQEISLLSQFKHENIVQYLGTDKDDSKLYIFLELVTKGSLANLYQKYQLRDSQVSAYTRQILNGLNYLHCRNVVHRDIKCANILVDASGSVKLADFGLAKATKLNDIKSSKGTAFWMAPEVVNRKNQGYGLAADIWSLGCTVLEMLTHKIPYSHLEGMQALFRIGKGEPPLIPSSLSVDARDFIFKCLQVIPEDRPPATQLLEHPFVKRQLSSLSVPPSLYRNGTRA